jgi:hypothetical protein
MKKEPVGSTGGLLYPWRGNGYGLKSPSATQSSRPEGCLAVLKRLPFQRQPASGHDLGPRGPIVPKIRREALSNQGLRGGDSAILIQQRLNNFGGKHIYYTPNNHSVSCVAERSIEIAKQIGLSVTQHWKAGFVTLPFAEPKACLATILSAEYRN